MSSLNSENFFHLIEDWGARGIHELYAWLYDNQSSLLITSGINGGSGGIFSELFI